MLQRLSIFIFFILDPFLYDLILYPTEALFIATGEFSICILKSKCCFAWKSDYKNIILGISICSI